MFHRARSYQTNDTAFLKSESHAFAPIDSRTRAAKKEVMGCWRTAKPSANTPNPDFRRTLRLMMASPYTGRECLPFPLLELSPGVPWTHSDSNGIPSEAGGEARKARRSLTIQRRLRSGMAANMRPTHSASLIFTSSKVRIIKGNGATCNTCVGTPGILD